MLTAFAHVVRYTSARTPAASATLIVSLANDAWVVTFRDAQGPGGRVVRERCGKDDPFCLFEQSDDAAALLRESLDTDTSAWLSWACGLMTTQDTVDVLAGFVRERAATQVRADDDAAQHERTLLAEERFFTEGY